MRSMPNVPATKLKPFTTPRGSSRRRRRGAPNDPPVHHGSGPGSRAQGHFEVLRRGSRPAGRLLELFPGEVHALAGENGAGKSTLIKTLAGVHRPDTGQVVLDGEPVLFHGPGDARDAGIAVIYQEPTLFPDLSIAENIFMGRQPRRALGRIDHKATHTATLALMQRLGVELDPDRPARGLSIADQQIVEIAKALSFEARVLIMDEPTAALTGSEVARLFGVVKTLREQGAAVLFISHRLEEIFRICQRVTTLRDGAWIASEPIEGMTEDDLVRRMVGRDLDELYPKQDVRPGEVALTVSRLTREASSPTSPSRSGRARSSASRGSSERAVPKSPEPCSASTAGTPARFPWTARPWSTAPPPPRWPPDSPWSPRTGAPRAS